MLVPPINEIASKFLDVTPEEIVELILIKAIEQPPNSFPDHNYDKLNNMSQTCRQLPRVLESRKVLNFLPKVYVGAQRPLCKMRR